jgi:hypothetical protein
MRLAIAMLTCLAAAAQSGPERREGALEPGHAAPDFRLKVRGSTEQVSLSSFRGKKPVALVFGSFT